MRRKKPRRAHEYPSFDLSPERIAANEQMLNQAIAAGRRQGRCGCCGRIIVGTGKPIYWRNNLYGEPVQALCGDFKDCQQYTQFLRDQADDCPLSFPNVADPWDFCPN